MKRDTLQTQPTAADRQAGRERMRGLLIALAGGAACRHSCISTVRSACRRRRPRAADRANRPRNRRYRPRLSQTTAGPVRAIERIDHETGAVARCGTCSVRRGILVSEASQCSWLVLLQDRQPMHDRYRDSAHDGDRERQMIDGIDCKYSIFTSEKSSKARCSG
jgi:hypothetical protein